MGTLFRIKVYAVDSAAAQAGFRAAFDRVAELDNKLSDYKPESELNRLSQTAVLRPVKVSSDLFDVLERAQAIAARSNGAFDVTLGPLTHLWREARKQGHPPDASAIREALAHCGFRKLHLDRVNHTVKLKESGMQLDLGGIAKGFAADQALSVLSGKGFCCVLVAASGDLAFSNPPPGEPGWKIGVDSLDAARQPFTKTLMLANAAVSTSGDAEQHLDDGGRRYSHIIDPQTGMALTSRITVTVIAPTGTEADGETKVVSVLGRKKGLAYIETQPRLAALVVERPANGPVKLFQSTRFPKTGDSN
jgi:thiamine biosynthesis lipoprotein